jgi:hypothetical protein
MASSTAQIKQHGGQPLLKRHKSLENTLRSVYLHHDWDGKQLAGSEKKTPAIFEKAEASLLIRIKDDWYRVSRVQIEEIEDGGSVMRNYKSVFDLVSSGYPEIPWEKSKFLVKHKRSTQRLVHALTRKSFPKDLDDIRHKIISASTL